MNQPRGSGAGRSDHQGSAGRLSDRWNPERCESNDFDSADDHWTPGGIAPRHKQLRPRAGVSELDEDRGNEQQGNNQPQGHDHNGTPLAGTHYCIISILSN